MSEQMDFPNTFEEFVNEYSFKDSDEIYTNGSELIQTFRVMQGYEHFVKQTMAELLEPYDVESIEDLILNVRNKAIDEVIKTLAENEDTILTDMQYYRLIEMKGGAENE